MKDNRARLATGLITDEVAMDRSKKRVSVEVTMCQTNLQ